MKDRPWFLWDMPITDAEFRERLRDPDPYIRAQWEGRLMREARTDEVWKYLSLDEVLRDWDYLKKHLGRMRRFWEYLLNAWREDGFIPA